LTKTLAAKQSVACFPQAIVWNLCHSAKFVCEQPESQRHTIDLLSCVSAVHLTRHLVHVMPCCVTGCATDCATGCLTDCLTDCLTGCAICRVNCRVHLGVHLGVRLDV